MYTVIHKPRPRRLNQRLPRVFGVGTGFLDLREVALPGTPSILGAVLQIRLLSEGSLDRFPEPGVLSSGPGRTVKWSHKGPLVSRPKLSGAAGRSLSFQNDRVEAGTNEVELRAAERFSVGIWTRQNAG